MYTSTLQVEINKFTKFTKKHIYPPIWICAFVVQQLFWISFSQEILEIFSFNFVVYTPWGGYGVAAGCGPCDKPEPNCPFIASGHSISSYFPIYSEQHIFQIVSLCIQYLTDSHFLIVSYFLSQCTHSWTRWYVT